MNLCVMTVRAVTLCSVLLAPALLSGCAAPVADGSQQATTAPPSATAAPETQCQPTGNLLKDLEFVAEGGQSAWRRVQHSSSPSFEAGVDNGVVRIEQKGVEPWYVFRQDVIDPQLAGKTLKFSAETRGNIITEPKFHGFDHVAGLYYTIRVYRRDTYTYIAREAPNAGNWDWTPVEVLINVPEQAEGVRVGFIHQAAGVLEARNPSLTVVGCGAGAGA